MHLKGTPIIFGFRKFSSKSAVDNPQLTIIEDMVSYQVKVVVFKFVNCIFVTVNLFNRT
jgi:hypothetical protein